MANIDIFGTLHNVTDEPIATADQVKDTTKNKTQAEINTALDNKTGADIPINGTDTGISIEQAISSVTSALNNLKGEDIPLSSLNSTKISTAIAELANAINAISLTTANVTEGTGESQTNQETINEGFRKKTANLNSSGELPSSKVTEGTGATKKTQAEINVEFRDKTLRLTGSGTLNALYVNDTTRNKTQKAINDELYNTVRPSCVELGENEVITSVNCVADTYYNIITPVNTLAINLPALTGEAVVKSVVVRFTVGNTPNITFTTPTGTIYNLINSVRFVPNSTYEISAISNTDSWHIGYIGVDEPLLKTHTYSANMALTGEADTYHVINGLVSGLTIHLPVVTTSTRLKSCMVFFKTTSDVNETLSITIDTTDSTPVVLAADVVYHKNDTYEINALYNGNSWVVSVNTYN